VGTGLGGAAWGGGGWWRRDRCLTRVVIGVVAATVVLSTAGYVALALAGADEAARPLIQIASACLGLLGGILIPAPDVGARG
jgi:hypothetical protein